MEEQDKRGPGRPVKPKMLKIRLNRGYVPNYIPEERMPPKKDFDEGVRPKAAAGSIIEEYEEIAKQLVRNRVADLAFDDEPLFWQTNAEKRDAEVKAEKEALEQRAAEIFAIRQAKRDLSV